MNDDIFAQMVEEWPSPVVSRDQIEKFSGGLIRHKTISNRDSLKIGISTKIRVGNKIAYRTTDVANYLRSRAKIVA